MHTIVFAGGGTAGHVMPNLALIDALKTKYNCVYVGGDGMEKSLCTARGIPFYTIKTVKLRRDKKLSNLIVPIKLISCVNDAKRALKDIKPSLIFSKGGFAALPVVLAAKRIPVISHESDFSPGLTTKLTKNKSARVLCAFENSAKTIKNGEHCGTPMNRALYFGRRDKAHYGLKSDKPVLTIVGGSSGAATLNDAVIRELPRLVGPFDIIHVTGKNKRGAEKSNSYCPVEFEIDMPRLYATTDVMITRAGANALAECIALGIPTIAVPLEKASRGDQIQNAEYYKEKGAITVLRENEITNGTLCSYALDMLNRKSAYKSAMSKLEVDGTDRICGIIESLIENSELGTATR